MKNMNPVAPNISCLCEMTQGSIPGWGTAFSDKNQFGQMIWMIHRFAREST